MRLIIVLAAALALAACVKPADKGSVPAASVSADAAAFLARNGKAPGVVVTPSGLQYRIIRSGPQAGLKPKRGDDIKINYEGALLDGTVFDSTYQTGVPRVMPLNGLVEGWMEALPMMRPGDEWELWIPPEIGYGDGSGDGTIPPGAVLHFRVELIDVLPAPETIGRG